MRSLPAMSFTTFPSIMDSPPCVYGPSGLSFGTATSRRIFDSSSLELLSCIGGRAAFNRTYTPRGSVIPCIFFFAVSFLAHKKAVWVSLHVSINITSWVIVSIWSITVLCVLFIEHDRLALPFLTVCIGLLFGVRWGSARGDAAIACGDCTSERRSWRL